jgi:hypothetical protein
MMTRLPRPRDGRVTHPLEDIPSLEEAHDQRVGDRDDFLAWVNSRVPDAEIAVHDGDAVPRREMWSRHEPVTVLGAESIGAVSFFP